MDCLDFDLLLFVVGDHVLLECTSTPTVETTQRVGGRSHTLFRSLNFQPHTHKKMLLKARSSFLDRDCDWDVDDCLIFMLSSISYCDSFLFSACAFRFRIILTL